MRWKGKVGNRLSHYSIYYQFTLWYSKSRRVVRRGWNLKFVTSLGSGALRRSLVWHLSFDKGYQWSQNFSSIKPLIPWKGQNGLQRARLQAARFGSEYPTGSQPPSTLWGTVSSFWHPCQSVQNWRSKMVMNTILIHWVRLWLAIDLLWHRAVASDRPADGQRPFHSTTLHSVHIA